MHTKHRKITTITQILLLLSLLFSRPSATQAQTGQDSGGATHIFLPQIANQTEDSHADQVTPRLAYQIDKTYRYQWELAIQTQSIRADSQGQQSDGNMSRLSGIVDLHILGYDKIADLYQIALAISNPSLVGSENDPAATALTEQAVLDAFATPLLFKQAATGAIIELQAAKDAPAIVTEIQKGIVNFLQVTLRDEAEYTVEEEGGQGRYRSHYTVTNDADGYIVSKTISDADFIEMVTAGTKDIPLQLTNQVDMHINADDGTLQSVHVVESVATGEEPLPLTIDPTPATVSLRVESEGWLKLLQVQSTTTAAVSAAATTYVPTTLRAIIQTDPAQDEPFDLDEIDLDHELLRFEQQPSDFAQMKRVAALLRQHPAAEFLTRIETRIHQLQDTAQLGRYIDLLRMTNLAATEQIVVEQILDNSQAATAPKLRALTQYADVETPTVQLVESVKRLSQGNDEEVRGVALLTLGALAHSLQQSDSEMAALLATDLVTQLQSASTDEEREQLLLAIGNAGLSVTEEAIETYRSHNNPQVSGAATLALRKLPTQSAERQLVDSLNQAVDPHIRAMAVIALTHRTHTPTLQSSTANAALTNYATVVTAAANGTWTKNWTESFDAGPLTINLPGNITVSSAPEANVLTLDANQSANGSIMGIDFDLFRAQLLSDAPGGNRRFGAYFWLGSNVLIRSYEEAASCNYSKTGSFWEADREFFHFSTQIPVYGILSVTLAASASGNANIGYEYQQQLCDPESATITGKIIPQTGIQAEGSAYLSLELIRGGVTLTADILKSSLPVQAYATIVQSDAVPSARLCANVSATIEPLSGKLTASAERRRYVLFGSWKSLGSWELWDFAIEAKSYPLLDGCIPEDPPPLCFAGNPERTEIRGTFGDDPSLNGTTGDDRICGFTGADVLNGLDGNDIMAGNQGNDTLNGGPGDDNVGGGKDNDLVNGNEGDDIVIGGAGDDIVYGNQGEDTVYGGEGNDIVGGGKDNDNIYADAGDDQIYGGSGDDHLWGGTGQDTFHYTVDQGNDTIYDFEWGVDQLRLYKVAFTGTTQLGTNCQVNLSSGATILLINAGICRNPTTSPTGNLPDGPLIRAIVNRTDGSVTVNGHGFAANETVSITVNGAMLPTIQTDMSGQFVYPLPASNGSTHEYSFTVPVYYFVESGVSTKVNLTATVIR